MYKFNVISVEIPTHFHGARKPDKIVYMEKNKHSRMVINKTRKEKL